MRFFRSIGIQSNLNETQSPNSDSDDVEIDGYKESKTQKYLISMIVAYAVCLCPLMVLRYDYNVYDFFTFRGSASKYDLNQTIDLLTTKVMKYTLNRTVVII